MQMFAYARDEAGKLVHANEAIPMVDYYCPYCVARMRLRRCTNKADHFYVVGEKHRSEVCSAVERERNVVRDPSKLNREKYMRKVLSPKRRGGSGGGPPGGGDKPNQTIKVSAPGSLEMAYVCGVYNLPPDTRIEDGVISDIFLTYRGMEKFLAEGESLGERILLARPHNAANGYIRFVVFWKNTSGRKVRHFLHLKVSDPSEYQDMAQMLFSARNGSYWSKPKYGEILVAGDWKLVSKDVCNQFCPFCKGSSLECTATHVAEFVSPNQIFCPEDKRID
jgi:hypothetical protein